MCTSIPVDRIKSKNVYEWRISMGIGVFLFGQWEYLSFRMLNIVKDPKSIDKMKEEDGEREEKNPRNQSIDRKQNKRRFEREQCARVVYSRIGWVEQLSSRDASRTRIWKPNAHSDAHTHKHAHAQTPTHNNHRNTSSVDLVVIRQIGERCLTHAIYTFIYKYNVYAYI